MTKLISEMTVRVDDDVLLQVSLEPAPEGQTVERWKACMTDRVEGLTVAQGRMVSGFLQILVQALPDPKHENLKGYTSAFKRSEDAKLIAEMKDEIDGYWQAVDQARKILEEALWNAGVPPNAGRGLVECAELAAARVQRLPEDDAQG